MKRRTVIVDDPNDYTRTDEKRGHVAKGSLRWAAEKIRGPRRIRLQVDRDLALHPDRFFRTWITDDVGVTFENDSGAPLAGMIGFRRVSGCGVKGFRIGQADAAGDDVYHRTQSGITIDNCTDAVLRHNTIRDSWNEGVTIAGSGRVKVIENLIYNPRSTTANEGYGLLVAGGCGELLIAGNLIEAKDRCPRIASGLVHLVGNVARFEKVGANLDKRARVNAVGNLYVGHPTERAQDFVERALVCFADQVAADLFCRANAARVDGKPWRSVHLGGRDRPWMVQPALKYELPGDVLEHVTRCCGAWPRDTRDRAVISGVT